MNVMYLLPELIVASFAIIVLMMDLFIKNKRLLSIVSIICVILAIFSSLSLLNLRASILNDMFLLDNFAFFFKLVFLSVTLLVLIGSIDFVSKSNNQGEYYSLLLFATLGMMIVASSGDLITLYIGLELASISTYVLAGFRKDAKGSEAAMKYFIVGALSSALIIFGISLLYGTSGTTNIFAISSIIAHNITAFYSTVLLGAIFLIAGFGFKMAAAPFHMWAPDTYEGAPSPVVAFLSAGTKAMAFAAAFKVFAIAIIALGNNMSLAFAILAIISMTLGNVVALRQTDIKRMLAYSSIGQVGYILIGFAVLTPLGYVGSLFHILSNAFMKGGAFLAVALVSYTLIGSKIEDYKGLGKRAPITSFALLIFLLSLIGIPPLAGFWSKMLLILAAIASGGYMTLLAIILVINSTISLFYYGRVIKFIYISKHDNMERIEEPISFIVPIILAVLALVIIGIFPHKIIDFLISAIIEII
jgi:NADH-quinone oxidoreductase subunit N|tara:strand:- start:2384 stop:3805 length:1422 start_codon:yes stop_codon:yes gene_type:complete